MENLMGRYRNTYILGAVIILQIVGLAVQVKRPSDSAAGAASQPGKTDSSLIQLWAVSVITPFEKATVRVQTGVTNIWHNYFYLRGVRQENRKLQDQIQQMQLEQVRLRQDAEQARRLQALLGFKEQFIDKTVAAQVIGTSGSEQSRLVYIDKGSDDGVKPDMAVITASGIVGKVSNVVNGNTSQVLLINDQSSGVGTILEQSRLQGVLKGRPSGELVLDKIMAEEEVKLGDRVLTSGGDQIFPKGLLVGTVANVTRGNEFLQVSVKPAAALSHLEEVLVITRKEDREPAGSLAATPLRAADILAQRLPSVPDKPPAPATGSAVNPGATPAKPAGPGLGAAAKPLTNATAAAGTQPAPVPNRPLTNPSLTSPVQAGGTAHVQPRITPPGAQMNAGQAPSPTNSLAPGKPPQGNPAQVKPQANSTGTQIKAPGTSTTGAAAATINPAPPKPAVTSQPKPLKPATATATAPPAKPAANTNQGATPPDATGDNPQ